MSLRHASSLALPAKPQYPSVCSQPYAVPGLTSICTQDMAWREQQRRLLSAHFGPREVESLAMNAVLPLDREEGSVAGAPLLWVQQREMKVRAGATRSASWVLTVNFRF